MLWSSVCKIQAWVLLVDFAVDSRSAGPSMRENFTDISSIHVCTYACKRVCVHSSEFSKVIRRKDITHLIVDSSSTREIDSQRRLLRGKCNYVNYYAPRPVTIPVFLFACFADDINPRIAAVILLSVYLQFAYNSTRLCNWLR